MSEEPKLIHLPSRRHYADLRGTSGFDMSGFKYIHEKPPNPIISLPPGPDVPIPTSSLRLDIDLDLVADEWDDVLRGRFIAEVRADMIREWDQIAMETLLTGDPSLVSNASASGPAPTPDMILATIAAKMAENTKGPPVPDILVSLFARDAGDGVMRLPPSPHLPFDGGYLATVAAARKLHQLVPLQLLRIMGPATGWYRPVCERFGPLGRETPQGDPQWPPFDDAS